MISGDDLYGWGVFDVPMERVLRSGGSPSSHQVPLKAEPARKLLQDLPWRIVGSSILLTVLCLVALLLLVKNPPETLVSSEPQPVEIAVRIFEDVPSIPPPDVVEPPAPAPQESVVVVPEEPPPIPEEPKVALQPAPEKTVQAAPVKPPEPIRIQPPPANLRLPLPSSLQPPPPEPKPKERPALPEQKAQVVARQEAVLPEPSRTTYKQRSTPASASLPNRKAALEKEVASVDLGAGPHTARVAERGTAPGALPQTPAIALERSDGTDLGDDAPLMNARYANLADSPETPLPVPQRTAVSNGGGGGEMLPKATAIASPGPRTTVAMLPPAERSNSSFGGLGRKADPDLAGPAVQTASMPQGRHVAEAPGKSYDFLDLVGPADLDRTVMMSLNQLQTCLDPEEELKLKTRLAAMLSRPGQCRSGGVVFDIRQPESAYSIHVNLYNYEQKEFQDRCSALRLAVYSCGVRR